MTIPREDEDGGVDNIVNLHPETVSVLAQRAVRHAEAASNHAFAAKERAMQAFDEARRVRQEQKTIVANVAALSAAVADNQVAVLNALSGMATEQRAREALAKQVQKAEFDAKAARADADDAEKKAGETTGRYDVKELLRQSQADADDRAIVQTVARTFLTQEEEERKAEEEARKIKNAIIARRNKVLIGAIDRVLIVVISVVAALVAARYGVHIGAE